ncbi:2006_t:CDS:1, partial [Dentiscutata erythropus]
MLLHNKENIEVSTNETSSNEVLSNKVSSNKVSSNEVSSKKTKYNDTHRGNAVRSWIWLYFKPEYEEGIRFAICQVVKVNGIKCGIKYKIGTSTSNCSTHLNNIH